MDGHKHVGLVLARDLDALAQTDVIVAVTRQHGAHAGLRVDQQRELARDGQRDVLLL
jgi:hypothetical protein